MSREAFLPNPENVISLHQAFNDVKGRVLVILDIQLGVTGYEVKLLIIQKSNNQKPIVTTWQSWRAIYQYITEGKMQAMPLSSI